METTVRHTEQDGTVVVESVESVATPMVSPFQPVFDALVKAVADQIMKQVLESVELESKISLTMDLLLEDKLDYDREIEYWFRNNFDIWDYSDNIEEMLDEDKVKSIVRDMTFSAD
jgi:hypothetical protein